jgi:PAS domain-containing protein
MEPTLEPNGARAVIGTDGAVWTANEAFCTLVRLDEPALRHLGWRQLVHTADRRYVAAHLVEVLAGDAGLREFDARLVPPDGHKDVATRLRVELVRDSDGRQGWFLVEAWATA